MRRGEDPAFEVERFLAIINGGKSSHSYRKGQPIFTQGDAADAVFYIHDGKIKLTVTSHTGKEAVVAVLNHGSFFGEGCLAGQPLRMASASCLAKASITRIQKKTMIRLLRDQREFSEKFTIYLLARNIRIEEDLVDQLFNSAEKRLARAILLLAHFGKEGKAEEIVPKISHNTLAEMVGTTRPRVSFFMNKFRKLGFIDYDRGVLKVHSSLLGIVLYD
jgi:CRP/FNR family transcriptional regulator, cyclic AMP receptor protein